MNVVRVLAIFALPALVAALPARPDSSGTRPPLHPKNVGDQPHHITVNVDDRDGDGKHFTVTVAAKDPKVPLEVEWGYLTVVDGDQTVCATRTHAHPEKGAVVYDFVVHRRYLEKSRFSFLAATATPAQRKNLPSGGGWANYEFTLKDFAGQP